MSVRQVPNQRDGVLESDLGNGVLACIAGNTVRLRVPATETYLVLTMDQIGKLNAAIAGDGRHSGPPRATNKPRNASFGNNDTTSNRV
jgi:hypothetical protein